MKQVPDLLRVRQQRQNVTSGQSRIGTGARGICGYDRDLQLYSIYHAACAGRKSYRTFRNGSSADSNGTSSWPFWCDLLLRRRCFYSVFRRFLGILFYARCNVAYLFGDNWASQTAYKVLALVMLFIGGLAAYTFVWDLW